MIQEKEPVTELKGFKVLPITDAPPDLRIPSGDKIKVYSWRVFEIYPFGRVRDIVEDLDQKLEILAKDLRVKHRDGMLYIGAFVFDHFEG